MIKVQVVAARPRHETARTVELPDHATVRDALAAAGFVGEKHVGVFGERVSPDARLADGDRVEVYRPLEIDPKEARRRRARPKR